MSDCDRAALPCSECGIDLIDRECWEITVERETGGFVFQGQPATREYPAVVCPECKGVTVL